MDLKIILVFLLYPLAQITHAKQDTLLITPESSLIDGTIIRPYTNKWKVTYVTAEGKSVPNKIWTDYGQVIALEGQHYFHRVQDLYDPQMNLLDTWINRVDHRTLVPVSSSTFKPTGMFSHVQFEGTTASLQTNMRSADSTVTKGEMVYDRKVYDWSLYGMLLVGLPFEEDLIAKMPILGADSLQWLHVHIRKREALLLPDDRKVNTWKVETNQQLTFWISESTPYVIKLILNLPNGAKLVWEMI
jgi:hypothetical protein